MHISFVILVAVLHVFMASAEPLPARSAHAMTVVQRRRGYKGSDQITSEEYQSEENNHSQEEEEDEWNGSNEQKYSEHESKDSSNIKSLEVNHSNETNTDNKNDEHLSNHHKHHHHHHSHEIGHLAANEKPYNYTNHMEAALNLADHREIAEVLYEITGFKDAENKHSYTNKPIKIIPTETMVIAYCKTTACLKTDDEAYEFLKSCGGARGIKFVIRLLKKLAGTANIKVIAELLKIITDEDCAIPGFKIISRLTGHYSIDGIIEVLQIISGRSNIADVIDFYEHNGNHNIGIDGISHQIYKVTGDVGPKEFPGVYEALKSEVDWTATFNILVSVMRCNDISEAIIDLKKIIGAKTFPEAIDIMKLVAEQKHFRYALEAFLEETGRLNLKNVFENLYKLTGKPDLMSVHQEFQRLYKINNIIKVLQTVNNISKKRDPLVVLSNLLDLTGAANLGDCSPVFTGLTFRQMTALDVIGQIQIEAGCTDIVEFLRGMLTVTGTKSLLKSWQIIVNVTQKNDIYDLINTLKQYTSVDLVTLFQFLLRITNTINIVPAVEKINELLETKGFFEWLQVLHHIVEMDVFVFLEHFVRLSPRSLLEDAFDVAMHYTDIYVPIQTLTNLIEYTRQEDMIKAIEYVKSNKPKHTTTTPTPSTHQEPIPDSTPESTSDSTTEPPETTSEKLETTNEQGTDIATEHTSEQPQVTTEAISETTTETLPDTTAESNTEPVSEATTDSNVVSSTQEFIEKSSTEQTPEAIIEKVDKNQQSSANSSDLSNNQQNIPSAEEPHPVTDVDKVEENPNPVQQDVIKVLPNDKQTPEKPITDAPKDQDGQTAAEDQKDVDKSKTVEPVSTAQSDVVKPDENTPSNIEIPTNQETIPVSDNNQTDNKTEPTGNDQKEDNKPLHSVDNKDNKDQPSSVDKETSIVQIQPVSNDQKDLKDERNPSNQYDTKDNQEKETIVTSDTQNTTDLHTPENPNNKENEDLQPASAGDQLHAVKEVTIIEHTNVPGEKSNQEKLVENSSESSPIDSSKNENVSNDKPKEENLESDAPNVDSSPDKMSPLTDSQIPTSKSTEASPEKPVEEPKASDQPNAKLPPDSNLNKELPKSEVSPPLNIAPVDQTPPNEIPDTQKIIDKPEQGTADTDNKKETSEISDIKPTDKESPISTEVSPDNSSPTNDKPDNNPEATQPSEPKLDEKDNKIPDEPTDVQSTTTNTTQSEQAPVSGPEHKDVKPDLQALQVNMNLKLLILPKGPKNTKNCYCACESQEPPKLIPMKHMPTGITGVN